MTSDLSRRLQEPRSGIAILTAVLSLVLSLHWAPMAVPSIAVLVLVAARPAVAARPLVWWLLAASWAAALVLAAEHMEDHVPLFAVWLVALAVTANLPDEEFLVAVGLQARLIVGVAFTAAVLWKLWFGTYLTGVTLWMFMVADPRFGPLSAVVGLSQDDIAMTRADLAGVLDGTRSSLALEASGWTESVIVVVASLTLALEVVIALSHLLPDRSRMSRLRLPSVVLFGVVTYGTVPVLPFAIFLALMTMTIERWRPRAMWVLPLLMLVVTTRVVTLAV